MNDPDVLIVGAGPVGLTLAIDLAWRGIDVTVVETRGAGRAAGAEMQPRRRPHHGNLPAARPCRKGPQCRLAGGLSARHQLPHLASPGEELTRITIPCRRDRFTATDGPDCNWPTPEPPHRINQIFLEPILFEHAAAQPRIRIINRTSVEDVVVGDDSRARQLARSRHRRRQAHELPLSDRLRRRALDRAQGDRRRAIRRRRGPARAVDLYPRARPDRPPAAASAPGAPAPSIRAAPAWSTRSTAASAGWCTIT